MMPRIVDLPNFLFGKNPTWPEISAVLNLIPEAALLFNRVNQEIVFGNRQFLELSAYTLKEITGRRCSDFLTDFDVTHLNAGQKVSMKLQKRLSGPVSVQVEPVFLDESATWMMLKIKTGIDFHSTFEKLEKQFELLLNLVELGEVDSEQALYERVLDVLSRLLTTDLICIYRLDSARPQAHKAASKGSCEVFPSVLSSADIIRLAEPMIWKPGKRVFTELHRLSRVADLEYVASVPIGHEQAALGLLVVGDAEKEPSPEVERIMTFFHHYMAEQLQKLALIDNLCRQNQRKDFSLAVLDSLMEHSEEGVVILSPDLHVIEINAISEVLLGYTPAEVCGQAVENVLIGSGGLIQILEGAVQNGKNHTITKMSLHRRDGTTLPVQIQVIPVVENGQPKAVLALITDVSEEEKIRIRTEQLENHAMLGEFTAIFAHEVRNPINNIFTGLQLLASRMEEGSSNLDLIERAQNDCTRLNELMESVLAFSRPIDHKVQSVNIAELLERVMNRWRPRMSRVNIESYFGADKDLPLVKGDARSLERVFTNLISNAVDVMSEAGGTLSVRVGMKAVANQQPQMEITIADNGPGIPDAMKERLFEPFSTNKPRGTGLGLAISKQIVTTHRGAIYASSFPGGTVFHIELPVDKDGEGT